MASIQLEGITKRFGSVTAVNRLSLGLQEGELIAFLGPSGCGKTTTLRMIAGFETPDEGAIFLNGRDVTHLPPERRNTGMVFQNYALFPHLTVYRNVAFGLEMRGVGRAEVARRVDAILAKVQLAGLEHRYPRQLSGGQQQRTALARALVTNPSVLLLDEPLANLDAKLREEMRFYVRSLQREFGITTVYVTHDQAEALVLADRIAVMMHGMLLQVGSPEEIYRRPSTAQVADFIGLTNLIAGRVLAQDGRVLIVETPAGRLSCQARDGLAPGARVYLSVRPESLRLAGRVDRSLGGGPEEGMDGAAGAPHSNRLAGTVAERAYLGNLMDYRIRVGSDELLRVQAAPTPAYAPGDPVELRFDAAEAWPVPSEGGAPDGRAEAGHASKRAAG